MEEGEGRRRELFQIVGELSSIPVKETFDYYASLENEQLEQELADLEAQLAAEESAMVAVSGPATNKRKSPKADEGANKPISNPSGIDGKEEGALSDENASVGQAATLDSEDSMRDVTGAGLDKSDASKDSSIAVTANTRLFIIADSGCFGKASDLLTLRPHTKINDDAALAVAFQLLRARFENSPELANFHSVLPSFVINETGAGFVAKLSVFPELVEDFQDRGTFYLISFARSLSHAWLTVIDFSKRTIKTYDSLNNKRFPDGLLKKLAEVHTAYNSVLKKALNQKYKIEESAWKVEDCESRPQGAQDCVVISLKNMEALLNDENPMAFVDPRRGSSYRKGFVELLLNTTEAGRVLLKRFDKDVASLLSSMELICAAVANPSNEGESDASSDIQLIEEEPLKDEKPLRSGRRKGELEAKRKKWRE